MFTGLVDQINEFHPIPSDLLPVPHGGYSLHNGMYYMSQNPNSPQVRCYHGDYQLGNSLLGSNTIAKAKMKTFIF